MHHKTINGTLLSFYGYAFFRNNFKFFLFFSIVQFEKFHNYLYVLASNLDDEYLLKQLEDYSPGSEHSVEIYFSKFLSSYDRIKQSIVLRLLRACTSDLVEPMLENLARNVKENQLIVRPKKPFHHGVGTDDIPLRESKTNSKEKKKKSFSASCDVSLLSPRGAYNFAAKKIPMKTVKTEPKIHFEYEEKPQNQDNNSSTEKTSSNILKRKLSPRRKKSAQRTASMEPNLEKKNILFEGDDDSILLSKNIDNTKDIDKEEPLLSPRGSNNGIDDSNVLPKNEAKLKKQKSPRRLVSIPSGIHFQFNANSGTRKKNDPIYLTPILVTDNVNILQCPDNTIIIRHRRKEEANTTLVPSTFQIDWQAEFVFNENATRLIAMYPKIIDISFVDEKVRSHIHFFNIFKSNY